MTFTVIGGKYLSFSSVGVSKPQESNVYYQGLTDSKEEEGIYISNSLLNALELCKLWPRRQLSKYLSFSSVGVSKPQERNIYYTLLTNCLCGGIGV